MPGNGIKVVGIDPAFRFTGLARATIDPESDEVYGLTVALCRTEANGTMKRAKGHKFREDFRRANFLASWLCSEIEAHGAQIAFIEMPIGSQSARAAYCLGATLGVLTNINIPIVQLTARQSKLAACGKPNASKEEMTAWAIKNYPKAGWTKSSKPGVKWSPRNEHMADAVAAIHAGINTEEYQDYSQAVSILPSI